VLTKYIYTSITYNDIIYINNLPIYNIEHISTLKEIDTIMSNEVEFEYTGKEEREDVPKDVTIVRFHPSVTEVDDYMFMECEQLKKVVFNEGLKKIGRNAFYGCRQLEQINLPSTLFEVDASAFRECAILRDVVFNEGPQNIGIERLVHIILQFECIMYHLVGVAVVRAGRRLIRYTILDT